MNRFKASIIDGVKRATAIQDELKKEVSSLKGNPPQLTTVLVGDDYVSHVYIKRKLMAAKAVGLCCCTHSYNLTNFPFIFNVKFLNCCFFCRHFDKHSVFGKLVF